MSLLFRKCELRIGLKMALVIAGAGSLIATPAALAAQYYFQPRAELSVEQNTNLELDSSVGTDRTEGAIAEVATTFGIATPRSETTLIPRLQYQYYDDLEEANRLQGDLGFSTAYKSARGQFNVYGGYEYRDELNAELSDARFDSLNPQQPLSPETGRVRPGATRGTIYISPTYNYKATERFSVGAGGFYQGIDYSPDDSASFIDFDYYKVEAIFTGILSQRSEVSLSPYYTKYKARDIDSQTDGVGASLNYEIRWSPTFSAGALVQFERDDIEQTEPIVNSESTNAWGAEFNLKRRGEISDLIFSIGRAVTPNGGGSLYYSDQFQVQYDRKLSERLTFQSAARYIQDSPLGDKAGTAERDYAQADLGLEWMMSRTWYLRGGYQYTTQEYELDTDSATNHQVMVAVGFRGLEPRR